GVTCSSITQAQCKDPKWREIIARDCPNVCGFCLEGGCVDAAIECANDKSICRNIDMQAFTMANCKKTCGYCENSSTTSPGGYTNSPGTCVDNSSRCASWKSNGFCENAFYTTAQKMQNCAKTCGFCK
ncbi:shTK domain protein, partial [Cooperia oncophora]